MGSTSCSQFTGGSTQILQAPTPVSSQPVQEERLGDHSIQTCPHIVFHSREFLLSDSFQYPMYERKLYLSMPTMRQALQNAEIRTLDELNAVAVRIEQLSGVGPKTAPVIRAELDRVALL
jgi:hypothetical protein